MNTGAWPIDPPARSRAGVVGSQFAAHDDGLSQRYDAAGDEVAADSRRVDQLTEFSLFEGELELTIWWRGAPPGDGAEGGDDCG